MRGRAASWWTGDVGGVARWLLVLAAAVILSLVSFVLWAPQSHLRLPQEQPQALFVGDSYSAGTGATNKDLRWTTLVSQAEGWKEINISLGGTGYAAEAGPSGCGKDFCPDYQGALDGYLESHQMPDLIIVSGGRNDLGKNGVPEAVREFWADLCGRRAPRVIVTSPLWHTAQPPASLTDLGARIKTASASCGARWLDLGQPLNSRSLLASDGVHPNDAGHAHIADAFEAAYRSG